VFETAECEVVRNSIFWELRYEKHENQMKGRGVELRESDLQMNAWTWRVYDTVKARRVWRMAGMQCYIGQRGKFELGSPFDRQPVELSEKIGRCK